MDARQHEVVKLNQIGIELYQFQKHLAASFHFNEALTLLRTIAAERERDDKILKCRSLLMQLEQQKESSSSIDASSLPSSKVNHKLRKSLLQPLGVDPTLPLSQPRDWDRVYALTILHNIALTKYAMNCLSKAEKTLRLALKLLRRNHQNHQLHGYEESSSTPEMTTRCHTEENDEEYHYTDNEEDDVNSKHQEQHDIYANLDISTCVVIMSIYHMLGTVISQMSGRALKEALECFIEAIHASREQLGGHVLVACVFVSMGRVLVREGYIQEASYAYDMAKCIYSTLQAGEIEGDSGNESILEVGCPGAPAA